MSHAAIIAIVAAVMMAGLLGVFIPVLPDIPLIWLGALAYGFLIGWGKVGLWAFIAITVLGAIGALAEIWGGGVGARVGGASVWAILGGFVLGVLGFFLFPPLGAIVGLLLGTFLVDAWRLKDLRKAAAGTLGMGVGYGLSFVVKLLVGLMMIGIWLYWLIMA